MFELGYNDTYRDIRPDRRIARRTRREGLLLLINLLSGVDQAKLTALGFQAGLIFSFMF